jgi:hypothetical protein
MAKIPSLGKPHNIRVNDAAYFLIQRRIIEARENGSRMTPIEIASSIIMSTERRIENG